MEQEHIQNTPIVQVALPTPLRRTFDYWAPEGTQPQPGMRIKVPFGRRELVGVVWGVSHRTDVDTSKMKAAIALLDEAPLLDDHTLKLAQFAAQYYHHPLGDVIANMLPTLIRQGGETSIKTTLGYALTQAGRDCDAVALKGAPKQSQALLFMQQQNQAVGMDTLKQADITTTTLQALIKKDWVCKQAIATEATESELPLNLTGEQATVMDAIHSAQAQFCVFLLQGVTGSGKTEIYLQTIAEVLERGKQVLVLVPEISLTPQTVARFKARFDVDIEVMHSNLTDRTRTNAWLKAKNDEARIIIGTRSAVFTPMPSLGLIVIDEEHDMSFKSQEGFRYHARDLAIWRAKVMNIPIILGSATPALESLYNAQQQKYRLLQLHQRATAAAPLKYHLIDLNDQAPQSGLSPVLIKHIQAKLDKNEQVMVFLNRRGFAPAWFCEFCGWIAQCNRCDARLTYHQNGRLICHHCDYQMRELKRCKECGSESHVLLGEGTQRIEQALTALFPKARIARIDRDSTSRKHALEQTLDKINQREYDILLGTQMLAKGHHFPYVTLVAILDADSGLLSNDFRALERLAQLLTQVSGRAGRAHLPGEVLIQTHHPDHPLLQSLVNEGYASFAEAALQERAAAHLPPFGHLSLLRAESTKALAPQQFLEHIKNQLGPRTNIACLGPIPAFMEKRQGKYRWQLLIRSDDRKVLHGCLNTLVNYLEQDNKPKDVRWSLDVDPQEMG